MARRPDSVIFAELLERFEPLIRAAFLDAIAEVRDSITLRVVVEMLERGDVEGAIRAMNLEPEAFARLEMILRDAYNSGGLAQVGNLPALRDPEGNRVRFFFSPRNMFGEDWVARHSADLITRATEDMKQAIRQHLTEGLSQGRNPTQTMLSVIGRVEKVSNRRSGGILGLTAAQERYVSSARLELLSGDPALLRNYLTRARRDKRFDRTIAKAIREGRPLSEADVAKITGRYSDGLLKYRSEVIGLNETMTALAKSRENAVRQQIDAGKIAAQDVRKVWKHTPQEHPRFHHRAMNGKSVGIDEQFKLPNGARMSYPHAPDAPAGETLGCKCTYSIKIDYFASVERRFKAAA